MESVANTLKNLSVAMQKIGGVLSELGEIEITSGSFSQNIKVVLQDFNSSRQELHSFLDIHKKNSDVQKFKFVEFDTDLVNVGKAAEKLGVFAEKVGAVADMHGCSAGDLKSIITELGEALSSLGSVVKTLCDILNNSAAS